MPENSLKWKMSEVVHLMKVTKRKTYAWVDTICCCRDKRYIELSLSKDDFRIHGIIDTTGKYACFVTFDEIHNVSYEMPDGALLRLFANSLMGEPVEIDIELKDGSYEL